MPAGQQSTEIGEVLRGAGQRRALIATLSMTAGVGGVTAMTRFIARSLRCRGYTPILAYYEPYSSNPALSVPSFRLLQRRPGVEQRMTLDHCETHALGAWLPELEFTHHVATEAWKRLIGIEFFSPQPSSRIFRRRAPPGASTTLGMAHSLEIRVPFVDNVLLSRVAPLCSPGGVRPEGRCLPTVLPLRFPKRSLSTLRGGAYGRIASRRFQRFDGWDLR